MTIFRKKYDVPIILAEHGRWIARLRDDSKVLDQRLHALERRVLAVESNLANLSKNYGRLDISLSKLETESQRLGRCER